MPVFLWGTSSQVASSQGIGLINYLNVDIVNFKSKLEAIGSCHEVMDKHKQEGREENRFVITYEFSREKLLELASKARSQDEIDASP